MALDYTIVTDVRQRFGDNKRDEKESLSERDSGIEADAPFVGSEKIFAFRQNLEINGQTVFGGIAPSVDFDSRTLGSGSEAHRVTTAIARWNGNVMLIHSGVLQENDNVVVVFKTGGRGGVLDPRAATATARTRKTRPAKRAKKAAKKGR